MTERTLQDCRVLVVEDEYMLADSLRRELELQGAAVVGPVAHLDQAIELIQSDVNIDGAVLDVNLGGEAVYPAADLLAQSGVPVVFTTGYDASSIPTRFAHVPRCEKPVDITKVVRAIGRVLHQ